ncbi:MAG: MbtH domain protein [bacterium]|nr:MbtH domain protein [bacterium]
MTEEPKKELNELVVRLSEEQAVETARPEKTAKALKECVDRDYVHVMFKKTGTEVGVQLYREDCRFDKGNFEEATGNVHIEGGLILNYDKVRVVADIDLTTCEGTGKLVPVSDEEYEHIMGKAEE